MVPHAGLIYSGQCAGAVFGRIAIPPVAVILAPNHTGRCGSPGASLWSRGAFQTPLGPVAIEAEFAGRLEAACYLVAPDALAHQGEHAVEVELPFLQVLSPLTRIVPVVLAWDDWARSEVLATALARVVAAWPEQVLLLASSDMTHFEPAAVAARKDRSALVAIGRLDGRALLETCRREQISMCGRVPAAVALEAARQLGATTAETVDYRHSGLVTGDEQAVVAYAGVVVR